MDGHTGVEHNIPVLPVYKDVLELWGNSNRLHSYFNRKLWWFKW